MYKTCPVCGKLHKAGAACPQRPGPKKYASKANDEAAKIRTSTAWRKVRKIVKDRDLGLCCVCAAGTYGNGVKYNAVGLECHHIIPIDVDPDMALDSDNCITLCSWHHHMADDGRIPDWYLRSLISREIIQEMLHVVFGPPCCGKTTYIRNHKAAFDICIDYDALASALLLSSGEHAQEPDAGMINYLAKYKQMILDEPPIGRDVWLPTTVGTEYIGRYATIDVVVIDVTRDEVMRRLYKSSRINRSYWEEAIHTWYDRHQGGRPPPALAQYIR